ncbi:PiggyBac transposable element-derived protein 4 [Cucumispora dikerogammari]|nr:PiggyBac transposable element-derived protein 4 [Cucumispora dikerogammari]
MCKFQGRCGFKAYIPIKPIEVGMKYYFLADAKTSFICNIKLYTCVYKKINDTVKCLIAPFLHKNHMLYMDNYYNSFKSCEKLIKTSVYCCDTVRSNRGEPEEYRKLKHTIKKRNFISLQKNNI